MSVASATTRDWTIRAFRPEDRDYESVVAVHNRVFPDYPETAEEWRFADAHRDPKLSFERHVVESAEGDVIAVGMTGHMAYAYDPRKLWMDVFVDPEHRGDGVGRALYEHLRARQARHDPVRLIAHAREDNENGRAFLARRGFVETMREWENHLDLARWDPAPWAGHLARVEADGIRVASYAELKAEDPEGFLRKLFDVCQACGRDVPSPEAYTAPDEAVWMKRNRDDENPNLLADGFVVAVDRATGTYVGVSNLWRCQGDATSIETGMTGVRREHRRRGVALAMKLRALAWARAESGATRVKTWNATGNEGMLAINEALGFVRQPAWIDHALDL